MAKLAIMGGQRSAEDLFRLKWPRLLPEDEAAVVDALRGNYWGGLGDDNLPNRVFERQFSKYHDAKFGITIANGTLTLELSLKSCGVRPGDEVIVPAITFIASASAIVSIGAVPVFADVDKETCQISAASIETLVTGRTRAIIVVHYGGYPADLDAILPIAKKHGLAVIEDCAHAQGSEWRGKKAGSWGRFGSFSFQHSKSLSAGEGGIVLTDDEVLYEKAVLLMNIGRKQGQAKYDHFVSASNWRMGGLQAALLLSQFRKFPQEAEERNRNGASLSEGLRGIEGIMPLKRDERITKRGYYFLVVDFDAELFGCSRQAFIEALKAEGVAGVMSGYNRPIYREPAFLEANLRPLLHESIRIPDYQSLNLVNAESWAARQATFAHFYLLGDGSAAHQLLETIKKIKDNVAELA